MTELGEVDVKLGRPCFLMTTGCPSWPTRSGREGLRVELVYRQHIYRSCVRKMVH